MLKSTGTVSRTGAAKVIKFADYQMTNDNFRAIFATGFIKCAKIHFRVFGGLYLSLFILWHN